MRRPTVGPGRGPRPAWSTFVLALALACFPRAPDAVHAQEPRPGWEIAPFGGVLAFDQDFRVSDGVAFRGLRDAPVFGGRLGYTVGRWIGADFSVGFSSQSFDPTDLPGSSALDVKALTFVGEALVHLASGSVVPFLAAGLGGFSFDVEGDLIDGESRTVLLGSVGGGLKIPLSPSVLFRVDGRDLVVRQDREVESLLGGEGDIRHNIGFTGAVAYRFGGPGDADRDDVYDNRDACPDTEPDLPVDETGCVLEIPEGPPPVKTDEDGDGVSDALDRCPSTPAGAVVDLDGCPIEDGGGTSGAPSR